jgi:CRP/FNR family transcriptional regulator, cyclic AMP receptor protein
VLAVLGPQEIFGASSVLDPGPRMASATALSEVRAAAIDRHAISSLILEHPRIAEQLLQILSRRGKHAHDELADLVFTDGTIGTPEAGALRVVHNLTQAEIAQLAGVSRETVNKSMSEFARRGWINIDGPGVLIRNPERLEWRAR